MHKFIKQETKSGKCLSNRFYTNRHLNRTIKNTRAMCEICSKLLIKTLKQLSTGISPEPVFVLKHAVNYWEVLFT